jgi:hypothetical protein
MNKTVSAVLIGVSLLVILGGCLSEFSKPPSETDPTTTTGWLNNITKQNGWLTTIAIVGIALSVAAFTQGVGFALPLFAGCVTLLTTVLVVTKYAQWIAILGFIVALAVFGYTIVMRVRKDRAAETAKTAVKEAVAGIQKVKDKVLMGDEVRKRINEILEGEQCPATVELVRKIKEDLSPEPNTDGATNVSR